MPKSSKKRKEKAADFSKAKLKLGKGKAAAANAVDTSFKARSIALPSQSITADKGDDGAPKTRRNLSIDELFVQLKHYNATVRKDAISGLKELLKAHPQLLESSLTQTFRFCAPLVTDEDASVRKALLSFFSWFFESVSADTVRPHAPVLLLFVTSAQTHIFPEIRVDGVRFLDVLLAAVPKVVTRGWSEQAAGNTGSAADGRRVLSGYLALLNASSSRGESHDTPSTSGAVLSPASRLLVLRSLSVFMRHAVGDEETNSTIPTWFFASSFNTRQAFESFLQTFDQSSSDQPVTIWEPDDDGPNDGNTILAVEGASSWEYLYVTAAAEATSSAQAGAASTSSGYSSAFRTAALAHSLQPMLTAAFLEGAPSLTAIQARAPPSVQMDIDTVVVVAEIMRTLYAQIFRSGDMRGESVHTAMSDLQSVLGYMETYFPFHVAGNDYQLATSAQRLNLIYCELTGLYVLEHNASTAAANEVHRARPNGKGKQRRRPLEITTQVERISDFVIGLLDRSKIAHSLSADAYRSLLPSIWSLLNSSNLSSPGNSTQDEVFSATVQHATQCSTVGPVKPLATSFVARLLLLQSERQYNGSFRVPSTFTSHVQRWLAELPKLCWELGDANLALTETILTFLLRFSQRSTQPMAIYNTMTSRLCPYFVITHQTRGKLPGPFAKLRAAVCSQGAGSLARLALDVADTLARHGESNDLRAAVAWAVSATGDAEYVL